MYECKIIADSISPRGNRLTTFQVTYPRFVHSEMMTHRMFSRNSSNSRAIPHPRLVAQIFDDPVYPIWWGKNQQGMQAKEELSIDGRHAAVVAWIAARDSAMKHAQKLDRLGVHKQLVNRLIEPWMWITVIITATDYTNFFKLRCHPDAQPEIERIARMMKAKYLYPDVEPCPVGYAQWHLPYVTDEEANCSAWSPLALRDLSVARCARVSYLTHDGEHDPEKDLVLAERLKTSGHWSPFEHQATPVGDVDPPTGNLKGWRQYRKTFAEEYMPG